MEVNEGIDALQKAEMIPDGIYELEMGRIRDEKEPDDWDGITNGPFKPSWCASSPEIVGIEDPEALKLLGINPDEIMGRRVDFWLAGKFGKSNLRRLLLHKQQTDPQGGWEDGIPLNADGRRLTQNLAGVRFKANVFSRPSRKGGYIQIVNPIVY